MPSGSRTEKRLTGALRAAGATGHPVRRVVIESDGKIVLVMIDGEAASDPEPEPPADQIVL